MQIPQFWAEARLVGDVQGKRRVVRRFGWSDVDGDTAQKHAEARAAAAMQALQAGQDVPRREAKHAYGDGGLPIREQVLVRRGDLVVTRNAYGARCLNEPDVLFADIDRQPRLPRWLEFAFRDLVFHCAWIGVTTAVAMFAVKSRFLGCSALVATVVVPLLLLGLREGMRHRPRNLARSDAAALARIAHVVAGLPGARAAVYDTPNGFRVLLLHATFDPAAETTQQLLRALGTDPAYAQMCALQRCFRARLSGKPWRLQGGPKGRLPGGVWPVAPERAEARAAWLARYEAAAKRHAACRFRHELGTGPVHARCGAVQRLHDETSGARSTLPLA
jgi:hypothetical protein